MDFSKRRGFVFDFYTLRLVEVADFNMGVRPRFVWSRCWAVLSKHFATVGCHENEAVAMYAVDSLKQLSKKPVCWVLGYIWRGTCVSKYPYPFFRFRETYINNCRCLGVLVSNAMG